MADANLSDGVESTPLLVGQVAVPLLWYRRPSPYWVLIGLFTINLATTFLTVCLHLHGSLDPTFLLLWKCHYELWLCTRLVSHPVSLFVASRSVIKRRRSSNSSSLLSANNITTATATQMGLFPSQSWASIHLLTRSQPRRSDARYQRCNRRLLVFSN